MFAESVNVVAGLNKDIVDLLITPEYLRQKARDHLVAAYDCYEIALLQQFGVSCQPFFPYIDLSFEHTDNRGNKQPVKEYDAKCGNHKHQHAWPSFNSHVLIAWVHAVEQHCPYETRVLNSILTHENVRSMARNEKYSRQSQRERENQ